jgi:hypothetical protein
LLARTKVLPDPDVAQGFEDCVVEASRTLQVGDA